MKATIKHTDGKTIELEGTYEEVTAAIQLLTWTYTVSVPSVFGHYDIPNVCVHEYPNPWMGVMPPCCIKCGASSTVVPAYVYTELKNESHT